MMRWARPALLVGLVLFASACTGSVSSEQAEEVVTNVVTLQSGTISDLRDLRGKGPYRRYERSPAEMLQVIEKAARRARGMGGKPVNAVFVSERYGEVIAKEREPKDADKDTYKEPFRSAVVATVHAVPKEPGASRVEIHATHRGPFHRGRVRWERDLPRWIDEVLAEEGGIRRIP